MKERLPPIGAAIGVLGSIACSAAMILALVGVLGAGVAASAASTGMAGMSNPSSSPLHNSDLPSPVLTVILFLVQSGPVILILSIAAVAIAVAIRHRIALVPVVAAGIVLYWGMYMQAAPLVMYTSVLLGLAALVATSLLSIRRRARS